MKERKTQVISFPAKHPVAKLENAPIEAMLPALEKTIEIANKKCGGIRDWDDKSKILRQIRMIGGKVYFFAEKEEENQ